MDKTLLKRLDALKSQNKNINIYLSEHVSEITFIRYALIILFYLNISNNFSNIHHVGVTVHINIVDLGTCT
jgi:hypothetical protein